MNISKISSNNFNGVYLSNSLAPGKQRELGETIRSLFISSGLSDIYEASNKDILIDRAKNKSVQVSLSRHQVKRILDDNYSRWNGRFN